MHYIIRDASLADFDALASILKTIHSDWTPTILADCFSSDYFVWIIGDAKPLGFIILRNVVDSWEIMQLAIESAYQRQGLASQLLKFVITQAQEKKIQKLILEVRPSNVAAIALYEKLGFVRTGMRKNYYRDGEDAILMDWLL